MWVFTVFCLVFAGLWWLSGGCGCEVCRQYFKGLCYISINNCVVTRVILFPWRLPANKVRAVILLLFILLLLLKIKQAVVLKSWLYPLFSYSTLSVHFAVFTPRARNCDSLVADATKNWALAIKFSELVASWRLTFRPITKENHDTT